jgi:alpha-glucoside transport system permease protein
MNSIKQPWWPLIVLGIISLIWLIPVVGILLMSFRPEIEIISGWWRFRPFTFTLNAWITVWERYKLGPSFFYSVLLAGFSTLIPVFTSSAAAFAYQFLRFPGKKVTLLILVNAFVLPTQVFIVPLIKLWRELGLIDNLLSCIIPFVGRSFAWSVFLIKIYLEQFPGSLIDAAHIDGCNNLRTYWNIVLPNALTPIAAVAILQFMWTWNSLLLPMLFLREKIPLPVMLARIQGTNEPNWDMVAVAAIVTTSVPLAVFLFFQRHFSAGSTISSGGKG